MYILPFSQIPSRFEKHFGSNSWRMSSSWIVFALQQLLNNTNIWQVYIASLCDLLCSLSTTLKKIKKNLRAPVLPRYAQQCHIHECTGVCCCCIKPLCMLCSSLCPLSFVSCVFPTKWWPWACWWFVTPTCQLREWASIRLCSCVNSPSLFMTCRDSSDTSHSESVALRSYVLMITQRYRDCCIRGFQLRQHMEDEQSVESQFQCGGL